MAFRIREITIHLSQQGQCMPASPDPLCTPHTRPVCEGKSNKPRPQEDTKPGGPRKRSLDLLQARLREVMATL